MVKAGRWTASCGSVPIQNVTTVGNQCSCSYS
jgi:hypothetical protein